jgi:hypothetical protein
MSATKPETPLGFTLPTIGRPGKVGGEVGGAVPCIQCLFGRPIPTKACERRPGSTRRTGPKLSPGSMKDVLEERWRRRTAPWKAARLGFSPFPPRFRIDVTERTPVTCEIRACFFPFPHTARQGVIRGESPWPPQPPHPPSTSAHPNVTMSRRDNHRWRIMMKYCTVFLSPLI